MKHFCSFSEAIREGAKLRPQIFGMFVSKNGSCALSAGAEAVLEDVCRAAGVNRALALPEYAYMEAIRSVPCPGCFEAIHSCLRDAVLHLNDQHKWTREAIADWLESEEEKLGFVTVVQPEPSCALESAEVRA